MLVSANVFAADAGSSDSSSSSQASVGSYGSTASGSAVAVPELDGSMAFLALGLTFALVGVARESRRSN